MGYLGVFEQCSQLDSRRLSDVLPRASSSTQGLVLVRCALPDAPGPVHEGRLLRRAKQASQGACAPIADPGRAAPSMVAHWKVESSERWKDMLVVPLGSLWTG